MTAIGVWGAEHPAIAAIATALASAGATVASAVSDDEVGMEVDAVMMATWPADGWRQGPIAEHTDDELESLWEQPMQATIARLQASHRALAHRDGGGRVIVLVPTFAMSGAPELAVAAATAEAQRVLVKSAARQWGGAGITVHAVAVDPALAAGQPGAGGTVSIASPALPAPDAAAVAAVVLALCGPAGAVTTGGTTCVDGGVWMSP